MTQLLIRGWPSLERDGEGNGEVREKGIIGRWNGHTCDGRPRGHDVIDVYRRTVFLFSPPRVGMAAFRATGPLSMDGSFLGTLLQFGEGGDELV